MAGVVPDTRQGMRHNAMPVVQADPNRIGKRLALCVYITGNFGMIDRIGCRKLKCRHGYGRNDVAQNIVGSNKRAFHPLANQEVGVFNLQPGFFFLLNEGLFKVVSCNTRQYQAKGNAKHQAFTSLAHDLPLASLMPLALW